MDSCASCANCDICDIEFSMNNKQLNFENEECNIREQLLSYKPGGGRKSKNVIKSKIKKGGGNNNRVLPSPVKLIELSTLPNDLIKKITAGISIEDYTNLKKVFNSIPPQDTSDESRPVSDNKDDTSYYEDRTRCFGKGKISDFKLLYYLGLKHTEDESLNNILKNEKIFLWFIIKDIIDNDEIDKKNVIVVSFNNDTLNLKFVFLNDLLNITFTSLEYNLEFYYSMNLTNNVLYYDNNCHTLNELLYTIYKIVSMMNLEKKTMNVLFNNAKLVVYPIGFFNKFIKTTFYKLINNNTFTKCIQVQQSDIISLNNSFNKSRIFKSGPSYTDRVFLEPLTEFYENNKIANGKLESKAAEALTKLKPEEPIEEINYLNEINSCSKSIILVTFERSLDKIVDDKVEHVPLLYFLSIVGLHNSKQRFDSIVESIITEICKICEIGKIDNYIDAIATKIEKEIEKEINIENDFHEVGRGIFVDKNTKSIGLTKSEYEKIEDEFEDITYDEFNSKVVYIEKNITNIQTLLKTLKTDDNTKKRNLQYDLHIALESWIDIYNVYGKKHKKELLNFVNKYNLIFNKESLNNTSYNDFYFRYCGSLYKFKTIPFSYIVVDPSEDGQEGGRNKNKNKAVTIKKFILGRNRVVNKDKNTKKQYIIYKGIRTFISDARVLERQLGKNKLKYK